MTLTRYSDAVRYPLTAWPGMSAEVQALTDACALEGIRAEERRWNKLTRLQRGQLAELEAKADHRASSYSAITTEHAGAAAHVGGLDS
jgi:hypothetical protein